MNRPKSAALILTAIVVATSVSLALPAGAAAKAKPTLTAHPARGLVDGQNVAVRAKNLKPSATFAIQECSKSTHNPKSHACAIEPAVARHATKAGSYRGHVAVAMGVIGNGDCNPGDVCYLQLNAGGKTEAIATIRFAKHAPKIATAVTAAYASTSNTISGVVTAHGMGVGGLSLALRFRASTSGAWRLVDTLTSKPDGSYQSQRIARKGDYEVVAVATPSYARSVSPEVNVSGQ